MTRTAKHIGLLCAFFPQLLIALLAPALWVCQEGDGGQAIELSVSSCCAGGASQIAEGDSLRTSSDEDCAGCQDSLLPSPLRTEEDGEANSFDALCALAPPAAWPAWADLPPAPRGPPACAPAPAPGARALGALSTVQLRC